MLHPQSNTPFDLAKSRISASANKISDYLSWFVIIGFVLGILLTVVVAGFILPYSQYDLVPFSLYVLVSAISSSGISSVIMIIAFIMILPIIILIALVIQIIVQIVKFSISFHRLSSIDADSKNAQFISYGTVGFLFASILGIFIPSYGGAVIMLFGSISLGVGAFFNYKLFLSYHELKRYHGTPSIIILIAVSINFISSITNFFTFFGFFGSIFSLIFLLFGLKGLSKEILLVQPSPVQNDQTSIDQNKKQKISQPLINNVQNGIKYCNSCNAEQPISAKFCQNCGSAF